MVTLFMVQLMAAGGAGQTRRQLDDRLHWLGATDARAGQRIAGQHDVGTALLRANAGARRTQQRRRPGRGRPAPA